MEYTSISDAIILKLLKADDEMAFKELYNRYAKNLLNEAYLRIGSIEASKEMVQTLFVSIWEKRHTLTINNLESYLKVAIKNKVLNYIESIKVQNKYQLHIVQNTSTSFNETEHTIHFNEFYKMFQKALEELPQKTSNIFTLRKIEKLSIKEIAEQLNISEKTVEYHLTTSVKTLRLKLKDFLLFFI